MSTDQPINVKDIKARFEAAKTTTFPAVKNNESTVTKPKQIFEKAEKKPVGRFIKNPSGRFNKPPTIKPKPKYLSQIPQKKHDIPPPPIPQHATILNPSIVSQFLQTQNNIVIQQQPPLNCFTNSRCSGGSSQCPSSSSTLSSANSDNHRDSVISDDALPSNSNPVEAAVDSSSTDDSPSDFPDDSFEDGEPIDTDSASPKQATLHTTVINEMKEKGLFEHLESIKENQKSQYANGFIEHESGGENDGDDEDEQHPRHSVVMRPAPAVPIHRSCDKYSGVEKKEQDRLIYMERLVAEICMKEEYFIKILSLMVRKYPEYLKNCELKNNKSRTGSKFNDVVATIVLELNPVLQAHESLLSEFEILGTSWDSRKPDLATTMLKNVDYLKICLPFLKRKQELCQSLKIALESNKEFAHATYQFEDQVMNCSKVHTHSKFSIMAYTPTLSVVGNNITGVSYLQQMDMIHQNVVRYKLFMDRYKKLLTETDVEEMELTDKVLIKLDQIVELINARLGETESLTLLVELQDKLQKLKFNVLCPGRSFNREGLVMRQARKDLMERRLILFSDCLLLCHPDFDKFWRFELDKMRIDVENNNERDKYFYLYSPKKSTAIVCASREERDSWVQDIKRAQNKIQSLNQRLPRAQHIHKEDEASMFSALWIADDETTMCMMADCTKRFNVVNRRHHCRKCGYVICRGCSGFAILPHDGCELSRVCSHCYYELMDDLEKGQIKWHNKIDEVTMQRVRFKGGKEKPFKDVFIPPKNGKRTRADNYNKPGKYLATGTAFTKNGTRYARLSTDGNLYFYAARYDPEPSEHYFITGHSCAVTHREKEHRYHFKLTQQAGARNSITEFSIAEKFTAEWENALAQVNENECD